MIECLYFYQFSEEKQIAALGVMCFCAEGDNVIDALQMAAHLNTHFKWLQEPVSACL